MPYRPVTNRDRWKAGGYTLLTTVVIAIAGVILTLVSGPVGWVVWLAIVVSGSLFLLARWHANSTAYRCPVCGHEFEISVFTDLVSPHVPDVKYLRCPHCGKRNWMTVLVKMEPENLDSEVTMENGGLETAQLNEPKGSSRSSSNGTVV